jgi:protein-arginine kinase activator protein McsA
MTIRERPRAFVYVCDGCGDEHVQENASGHYANSVPPAWVKITVQPNVASERREYLVCDECGPTIVSTLRSALDRAGASRTELPEDR